MRVCGGLASGAGDEKLLDVYAIKAALISRGAEAADFASIGPAAQGLGVDANNGCCIRESEVFRLCGG